MYKDEESLLGIYHQLAHRTRKIQNKWKMCNLFESFAMDSINCCALALNDNGSI